MMLLILLPHQRMDRRRYYRLVLNKSASSCYCKVSTYIYSMKNGYSVSIKLGRWASNVEQLFVASVLVSACEDSL